MTATTEIPEDRSLTPAEIALVQWLLQHGVPEAVNFLPQLQRARVISRCYCGCASINFAIDDVIPLPGALGILADYEWQAAGHELNGVYVFERGGLLAGLEVWSQDGRTPIVGLPEIKHLRPIGTQSIGNTKHSKRTNA